MCIPAVEILDCRLLILAAVFGIFVQLLAVLPGSLDYLLLIRSQQSQRKALFVSGSSHIDFEDIRFNPRYGQLAGNWILVRCLLHAAPQPVRPDLIDVNGTPLCDAFPPGVWSSAAQWDFRWARREAVAR